MGFTGREPPFFFMKPADAVLPVAEGQTGRMHYPTLTQDLHHEVELVVAIGTAGRNIAAADAMKHVWGYAVGLDMTRRDLQGEAKKQGRPWCIGKGFEESAPIGPIRPAAQCAIGPDTEIVLDVRLRIICATLMPRIWPSTKSTLVVPDRLATISRGLRPVVRTSSWACILPSSEVKFAALVKSGNARTPRRSARIAKIGLAIDASRATPAAALPS